MLENWFFERCPFWFTLNSFPLQIKYPDNLLMKLKYMNTFMFVKITFNYDSAHALPLGVLQDYLYDSLKRFSPCNYYTSVTLWWNNITWKLLCLLKSLIAANYTTKCLFNFLLVITCFSHQLQLHVYHFSQWFASCYSTWCLLHILLAFTCFSRINISRIHCNL